MQTSLFSWNWGSTAKHLVSLTNFLWQTFNRGLLFLTPYPKHTINNRNCKDFFKISSWSCVESNFCDVNVRLISKIWAIGLILMIPEFLLQYTMNCLLLLKTMQFVRKCTSHLSSKKLLLATDGNQYRYTQLVTTAVISSHGAMQPHLIHLQCKATVGSLAFQEMKGLWEQRAHQILLRRCITPTIPVKTFSTQRSQQIFGSLGRIK